MGNQTTGHGARERVLAKLKKAHNVVVALCRGEEKWTMHIPARPEHDPDLVIGGALREAQQFIESRAALAAPGDTRTATSEPYDADLQAYRLAPGGEGPHAADWADKPHRLIYDLVRLCQEARRAAAPGDAEPTPEQVAEACAAVCEIRSSSLHEQARQSDGLGLTAAGEASKCASAIRAGWRQRLAASAPGDAGTKDKIVFHTDPETGDMVGTAGDAGREREADRLNRSLRWLAHNLDQVAPDDTKELRDIGLPDLADLVEDTRKALAALPAHQGETK